MLDRSGLVLFGDTEISWSTCFETDLAAIYAAEIRRRGHRPPANATRDQLGRLLHDWRHRRLEGLIGCPLTVRHSKEIRTRSARPAIAEIERRASGGQPLWPFTSNTTRRPKFNDQLLNHWGIVHLHLGASFDKEGYVARTGELLYAWPAASDFYLLDVRHHGSFADRELLDIAIGNWPEAFERFVLDDVHIQGPPPSARTTAAGKLAKYTRTVMMHPIGVVSPSRTKELRKQGLNATFQSRTGAHYYPPGGGYSCAGTGIAPQTHADHEAWFAGQLAATIANEIAQVAEKLVRHTSSAPVAGLQFQIRDLDELKRSTVFEKHTASTIQLPNVFDHAFDPTTLLRCLAAAAMLPR